MNREQYDRMRSAQFRRALVRMSRAAAKAAQALKGRRSAEDVERSDP